MASFIPEDTQTIQQDDSLFTKVDTQYESIVSSQRWSEPPETAPETRTIMPHLKSLELMSVPGTQHSQEPEVALFYFLHVLGIHSKERSNTQAHIQSQHEATINQCRTDIESICNEMKVHMEAQLTKLSVLSQMKLAEALKECDLEFAEKLKECDKAFSEKMNKAKASLRDGTPDVSHAPSMQQEFDTPEPQTPGPQGNIPLRVLQFMEAITKGIESTMKSMLSGGWFSLNTKCSPHSQRKNAESQELWEERDVESGDKCNFYL
ncbi:hypothetical protein BKA82DRAFT_21272, partial [Pisolithus tinctorius]